MHLTNILKAFSSALGLTGALIVIGYIVESAYQSFLGTEPHYLGATTYLGSGSEFLLELSLLTMRLRPLRVFSFLAIVVGMLLAGWLIRRHSRAVARFVRPKRRLLMVLIAIAAAVNFAYYAAPTSRIENTLSANLKLDEETAAAGANTRPKGLQFTQALTQRLWHETICAHMPSITDSQSNDYNAMVTTCQNGKPHPDGYQDAYLDDLRNHVGQNLLNAFLLVSVWVLVAVSSRILTVRMMDWETLLAGIALFLALAAIPYHYGKTLRIHPVRLAAVYSTPDLKPIFDAGLLKSGLILFDDESGVTFLEASQRKIWFLPRSKIAAIKIQGIKDILQYFIEEGIAKAQT